jgi:hypothetical protein
MDLCKLEESLVYIASYRTATTWENPASKKKKKKKKKKTTRQTNNNKKPKTKTEKPKI